MKSYISINNNFETRINSRSGGIFSVISDYILENDGVIYGVILDSNKKVIHIRTQVKSERDKMRGSKYVQSDLNGIYEKVKKDLKEKKMVLFVGTGCQVSGLYNYLKDISLDKLLTIDIICNGVIAQGIYIDYINYLEKKNQKKIKEFEFRNKKKYGWNSFVQTIIFEDNTEFNSNIFTLLYESGLFYNKSCYLCKYKSIDRVGDITLGDAWGSLPNDDEINDNNGVSLILSNTEKGDFILSNIKESLTIIECDIKMFMQDSLKTNQRYDKKRDKYINIYKKYGIKKVIRLLIINNKLKQMKKMIFKSK